MRVSVEYERALRRAELRAQIADVLHGSELTSDDRRQILLDLLVGIPPVSRPGNLQQQIVEVLRRKARAPVQEIARAVYGSFDKKAQSKVRSRLSAMKGRGIVNNTGLGTWEVVEK